MRIRFNGHAIGGHVIDLSASPLGIIGKTKFAACRASLSAIHCMEIGDVVSLDGQPREVVALDRENLLFAVEGGSNGGPLEFEVDEPDDDFAEDRAANGAEN